MAEINLKSVRALEFCNARARISPHIATLLPTNKRCIFSLDSEDVAESNGLIATIVIGLRWHAIELLVAGEKKSWHFGAGNGSETDAAGWAIRGWAPKSQEARLMEPEKRLPHPKREADAQVCEDVEFGAQNEKLFKSLNEKQME